MQTPGYIHYYAFISIHLVEQIHRHKHKHTHTERYKDL